MNFKTLLREDIHKVFLNIQEFSENHIVNGVEMPCQVDANEEIEREKRFRQNTDGVFLNEKLIYVPADKYGPLPKNGSIIMFDGKKYTVQDAVGEDGIYSITLRANKS